MFALHIGESGGLKFQLGLLLLLEVGIPHCSIYVMASRLPVTHFTRLICPGCSRPTQQLSWTLFQPPWLKSLSLPHMQLACDGLWDVLPSQRAIEFARQRLREHNNPQQCAQKLVRLDWGVGVRGRCFAA